MPPDSRKESTSLTMYAYVKSGIFPSIIAAALLCQMAAPPAIASGHIRTVALEGTAAPSGEIFSFGLFSPVINRSGETAFIGFTPVGNSNRESVWSEGGGSLALVAREGEAAPGAGSGVSYHSFLPFPLLISDEGHTAFLAFLIGIDVRRSEDHAFFKKPPNSDTRLVARAGDAVRGSSVIDSLSFASGRVMNASGQTAFPSSLTGTGTTSSSITAVFSEGGGTGLDLIARQGDTILDAEDIRGLSTPVLNVRGQTAFSVAFGSAGRALLRTSGDGGFTMVARNGDVAPETDGATFTRFFSNPVISGNGQVSFFARLSGSEVDGIEDAAIFSERNGDGLSLVIRTRDKVPCDCEEAIFSNLGAPVLNGSGNVAFFAEFTGGTLNETNNSGIFSEGDGGDLKLVARSGDIAPGTDALFDFRPFPLGDGVVLNAHGQTAFQTWLTGEGVGVLNNSGIWAENLAGELQLIARAGDVLDVSDDPARPDLRTISFLRFVGGTGNEDGRGSGFNDVGQLAFSAGFTDGTSGIFVSNLVAIPEPGTMALAGVTVLGLIVRGRLCCSESVRW